MLIELLDKLVGGVSKKWLIGRRMVVDLSEAKEARVAVIELPEGTFSFDIRDLEGYSELVLVSDAGVRVVATYVDRSLAVRASKKIRFAITRPLKKAVWGCLGILLVIFTFDLATTPRSARVAGRPASGTVQAPAGLSMEQLAALQRARALPQPAMPAAATVAPDSATPAPSASEPQSSPEAQAALRLLSGK